MQVRADVKGVGAAAADALRRRVEELELENLLLKQALEEAQQAQHAASRGQRGAGRGVKMGGSSAPSVADSEDGSESIGAWNPGRQGVGMGPVDDHQQQQQRVGHGEVVVLSAEDHQGLLIALETEKDRAAGLDALLRHAAAREQELASALAAARDAALQPEASAAAAAAAAGAGAGRGGNTRCSLAAFYGALEGMEGTPLFLPRAGGNYRRSSSAAFSAALAATPVLEAAAAVRYEQDGDGSDAALDPEPLTVARIVLEEGSNLQPEQLDVLKVWVGGGGGNASGLFTVPLLALAYCGLPATLVPSPPC